MVDAPAEAIAAAAVIAIAADAARAGSYLEKSNTKSLRKPEEVKEKGRLRDLDSWPLGFSCRPICGLTKLMHHHSAALFLRRAHNEDERQHGEEDHRQ